MTTTANDYHFVGPTSSNGNLLVMDNGTCIATVKYDIEHAADCRRTALRLARSTPRMYMLKHLLAEMESDEGRWAQEIQMIRNW